MKLLKTIILFSSLVLFPAVSVAQDFNIGAGVVYSKNLGFDEFYTAGLLEASFTFNGVTNFQLGIEVLDAEKKNHDGWGSRLDAELIQQINNRVGVLVSYRPSYISVTEETNEQDVTYSKMNHMAGIGLSFGGNQGERYNIYYEMAVDDYHSKITGFEVRAGKGHWFRFRADSVLIDIPHTNKSQRGARIGLTVAPRMSW